MAEQAVQEKPNTWWKYLGAMMMEEKAGHMAVSYTRTLGLILFFACLAIWCVATFMTQEAGKLAIDVPQNMIYTLWGLIGIKGGKDIAKAFNGKSSYTSE